MNLPDLPANKWRGSVTERQLIERVPVDVRKSAQAKVDGKPLPILRYVVGQVEWTK